MEEAQRAKHIFKHHSYIPKNKIHKYVQLDFIELKSILDISKPKTPTHPQVKMTRLIIGSQTPGAEKYKPVGVPQNPKSSKAEDLFEYAVKRIALKYQTEPDILLPKTHKEWMNYCFDPRITQTPLREEFMSRIKAIYSIYFKKSVGIKYTFDFESILRDYPHFFASGDGKKPINYGLDGMIEAMRIEINLSRRPDKQNRYKITEIEIIDEDKRLYGLKLKIDDSKIVSFNDTMNVKLKIKDNWYNCDCIDFNDDESMLM